MNAKFTAVLVTLSIALAVGVGLVVHSLNDQHAVAERTSGHTARQTSGHTSVVAKVSDRRQLKVGHIVPGGIQPVMVGDQVFEHIRTGFLVADQNPPCDGNHWLWAGHLADGLLVAATPDGTITALGSRTATVNAGRLGVGSTLRELKASYGEFLNEVTTDDEGQGWTWVSEQGRWIGFELGPVANVTDDSRVTFVEVGTGAFLHHFADAC